MKHIFHLITIIYMIYLLFILFNNLFLDMSRAYSPLSLRLECECAAQVLVNLIYDIGE
jgi:hypothetical protein